MAKRATTQQQPYNPVGEALAKEVMAHRTAAAPAVVHRDQPTPPADGHAAKVLQHPRTTDDGQTSRTTERLSHNPPLRVLLPSEERDDIDALVNNLAKRLGTRVKTSHVLRACLRSLLRCEDQLLRRAEKLGRLIRPPNNDPLALAKFEDDLTDLIEAALHDTPPPRRGSRSQRVEG